MKITLVPKSQITPAFGMYFHKTDTACIRDDLPKSAELFVTAHELGHSLGYGEIMATISAMIDYPIGFIITVFMSLAPYRLAYYFKRIFYG